MPQFVDLATLSAAVCAGELSGPAHAAWLLGTNWPSTEHDPMDRARAACSAVVDLYRAAGKTLAIAAPGLPPHKAWSTGVERPLSTCGAARRCDPFPGPWLTWTGPDKGAVAAAFFGPPCEAAMVGIACPMALVDLFATYPGCWSALGLTRLLLAKSIVVDDATDEFLKFIDSPNLVDKLYGKETAARWGGTVVLVAESDGAALPRAVEWAPGDGTGGTVAPLHVHDPAGVPLFWCDVAAAIARGGRLRILRALRPRRTGTQRGLRPYRLPDGTEVDPRECDLGDAWREMRVRAHDREGGIRT